MRQLNAPDVATVLGEWHSAIGPMILGIVHIGRWSHDTGDHRPTIRIIEAKIDDLDTLASELTTIVGDLRNLAEQGDVDQPNQ